MRDWINDGLMTLFFFLVALEIKREPVQGKLNNPRMAALPIVAALGNLCTGGCDESIMRALGGG